MKSNPKAKSNSKPVLVNSPTEPMPSASTSKPDAFPCLAKYRKDHKFREFFHQKIKESLLNPDPIFQHPIVTTYFADGVIRPLSENMTLFNRYSPEQMKPLKKSTWMDDIEKNEAWFKSYWEEHPEASLAAALRVNRRVNILSKPKSPIDEAKMMLIHAKEDNCDPIRSPMVQYPSSWRTWSFYLIVCGEKFLQEAYRAAFEMEPKIFSGMCASTADELLKLNEKEEIDSLEAIHEIMLEVLREGEQSSGIKEAIRQCVRAAIAALEGALGIDKQKEALLHAHAKASRDEDGGVKLEQGDLAEANPIGSNIPSQALSTGKGSGDGGVNEEHSRARQNHADNPGHAGSPKRIWHRLEIKVSINDDLIEYSYAGERLQACYFSQMGLTQGESETFKGLALKQGDGHLGDTLDDKSKQRYKRLSDKLRLFFNINEPAIIKGKTVFPISQMTARLINDTVIAREPDLEELMRTQNDVDEGDSELRGHIEQKITERGQSLTALDKNEVDTNKNWRILDPKKEKW